MIKVQVIGNVLAKGSGIGRKSYAGPARIVRAGHDSFQEGDILVATATDANYVSLIARAGALIVEEGGLSSHAAIAALNYSIPAVVGASDITSKVTNGQILTVDAMAGVVYDGAVTIL